MPLYEFQCSTCEKSFEELLFSASKLGEVKCPKCGSAEVRRKVSTFASKVSGGGMASSSSAASCAPGGT